MDPKKNSTVLMIMDELAGIETRLAAFYGRCADAFRIDRDIWKELEADERSHVDFVSELKSMMILRPEAIEPGKVGLPALQTYKKGIEEQIFRLERGEIPRMNALFIARDFENTLIEKAFYSVLRSRYPEFMALTGRIDAETQRHRDKLNAYIEEITSA